MPNPNSWTDIGRQEESTGNYAASRVGLTGCVSAATQVASIAQHALRLPVTSWYPSTSTISTSSVQRAWLEFQLNSIRVTSGLLRFVCFGATTLIVCSPILWWILGSATIGAIP